ncbi:MAG: hypothetical protein ACREFW_07865 [Rhizomicrobium sp.]
MATPGKMLPGPHRGSEAEGYSAAYERERKQALDEERDLMAGPKGLTVPIGDTEMKNPDGEFQNPAPMSEEDAGRGKSDPKVDPEGQQGGTEGGRPPWPPIELGGRPAGTPLEAPGRRGYRRTPLRPIEKPTAED